jgi:hypothetical protein
VRLQQLTIYCLSEDVFDDLVVEVNQYYKVKKLQDLTILLLNLLVLILISVASNPASLVAHKTSVNKIVLQ